MSWKLVKLNKIASVQNGYAFRSKEYVSDGMRVLRITNVQKGEIVDNNPQYIDFSRADEFNNFQLHHGDILISLTGNVGRVGVLKKEHEPAVLNQRVGAIRVISDSVSQQYLFLYLNSNQFEKDAIRNSKGIAQLNLSSNWVENYEIPLPPKDDQIRIATLLSRIEALIATRKNNLRLLDEFLKSTFLEMFGDPVRNEKGWDTAPLSRIGHFFSGGTPRKKRDDFWSGEFPWVSPKDMKVPYISDAQDHISEKVFAETSLKRIDPEHLLIVVRGMILAHSFPVAINTVPVAINQDLKAILPNAENKVRYLMACLNAMKRQVLTLISSAGHGTKRFDSLAMNKLFVPSPPLNLQNQFASIVKKVEFLMSLYQHSLSELENLYGAISQKAFKGELDLSRIPLKEVPEETVPDIAVEPTDEFPEPDTYAMSDPAARVQLLRQLFDDFIPKRKGASFSLDDFWTQAEQKIVAHMDEDSPPLGVGDYDKAKAWLFDRLKSGRADQCFNENNNRMELSIKG